MESKKTLWQNLKRLGIESHSSWFRISLNLAASAFYLWLITKTPQRQDYWDEATVLGLWLLILLNCFALVRKII